jgi:outer membrane receptor protein involved in Fe transport
MRYVNLDDISVHGLEAVVEILHGRPIGGGLAYIYGEAASKTLGLDPIDNFPAHRFEAWLETTWRGHAGAVLRVRYVSARTDQGMTLDPYAVVDLSGWARLNRFMKATLRVDNLLDERYLLRSNVAALPPVVALSLEGVWE